MNDVTQLLEQLLNFTMNKDTSKIGTVRYEDLMTEGGQLRYQFQLFEQDRF